MTAKCRFCNYEWQTKLTAAALKANGGHPKSCPLCKRYQLTKSEIEHGKRKKHPVPDLPEADTDRTV